MLEPLNAVRTAVHDAYAGLWTAKGHTAQLVDSHNVIGARILDFAGEAVGRVDGLMIDKQSGTVRYLILGRGGLLGVARERYAIPWATLEWVSEDRAYFSDLRLEDIQASPHITGDWRTRTEEFVRKVDDYWANPTPETLDGCEAS